MVVSSSYFHQRDHCPALWRLLSFLMWFYWVKKLKTWFPDARPLQVCSFIDWPDQWRWVNMHFVSEGLIFVRLFFLYIYKNWSLLLFQLIAWGLASCPPPKTALEALSFRKLKLALKDDSGIHVESFAKAWAFFSRIEKLTVLMEVQSRAKSLLLVKQFHKMFFLYLCFQEFNLQENCCLLSCAKCWWRDLERTLSGMEQFKDISLHDFLRVSDKLLHANYWRSAFKVEFKMIQIRMQTIKNLEKLTMHASRDLPKRVPMNFMSLLLRLW